MAAAAAQLLQGHFSALWRSSNPVRLKNHYHCLMTIHCPPMILIFIHCRSNKHTLRRLQIIIFSYFASLSDGLLYLWCVSTDGLTLLNTLYDTM